MPLIEVIIIEFEFSLLCRMSVMKFVQTRVVEEETYPFSSPIGDIEKEIPATLFLRRKTKRRWKIGILHHPLLQLNVPSPVAVVQLLCCNFLKNVSGILVEDGK